MENHRYLIRFKYGEIKRIRDFLLADTSKERFAAVLGKHEQAGSDLHVIRAHEIFFVPSGMYESQSLTSLKLKKEFIHKLLVEVTTRPDRDSLIDIHSHPFSKGACFSGIDDHDEKRFLSFLAERFDGINYASILFSLEQYSARVWQFGPGKVMESTPARIKAQSALEPLPPVTDSYHQFSPDLNDAPELFSGNVGREAGDDTLVQDRSVRALGLDTMRRITSNQVITIVGVGGIGSVAAEHLVHMGFRCLNLIDHDRVELTNMNRFVGAKYEDAMEEKLKVECVRDHLLSINPNVRVAVWPVGVASEECEPVIAGSDWVMLFTDNHSSRYQVQELAFKYFVPFISGGVNITVNKNRIEDISGEVITIRMGDRCCLSCLGRINYAKMANESHPDKAIRDQLVKRGYVEGSEVKEPAVKTLNTFIATMAVDCLVDQYAGHHRHRPVLVYENNDRMCIYEDRLSMEQRPIDCFICNS